MKVGEEVIVTKSRGEEIKPVLMWFTGKYSAGGQPILRNKEGAMFRALLSDPTNLSTGCSINRP